MLEELSKLLKATRLESGRTSLETPAHPTPYATVSPRGGSDAVTGRMSRLSKQKRSDLQHTPGPHLLPGSPPSWASLGQPSLAFSNSVTVLMRQDPTMTLPTPRSRHKPPSSPSGSDHLPQTPAGLAVHPTCLACTDKLQPRYADLATALMAKAVSTAVLSLGPLPTPQCHLSYPGSCALSQRSTFQREEEDSYSATGPPGADPPCCTF